MDGMHGVMECLEQKKKMHESWERKKMTEKEDKKFKKRDIHQLRIYKWK